MLGVRPARGGPPVAAGAASWPSRLGWAVVDAVFPPACPACGLPPAPLEPFCPACRDRIRFLTDPLCRVCGRPAAGPSAWEGPVCPTCLRRPPAFEAARAAAEHAGPLAEAVRGFKYMGLGRPGGWHLGPSLARLLSRHAPGDWLAWAQLVTPVPLHPRRLWRRGFNQALVLARALAAGQGPELAPDLLARRRHTRPQVGLGPAQRRQNVAGAFSAADGADLTGRRVLLVDDVFTTGATADECARALLAAGADGVRVLTLVRAAGADPAGDGE